MVVLGLWTSILSEEKTYSLLQKTKLQGKKTKNCQLSLIILIGDSMFQHLILAS